MRIRKLCTGMEKKTKPIKKDFFFLVRAEKQVNKKKKPSEIQRRLQYRRKAKREKNEKAERSKKGGKKEGMKRKAKE